MPQLTRITRDPAVMGGKPCIRGMRVTVGTVVGLVAAGRTRDEILREYPYLEARYPRALSYAAWGLTRSKFRGAVKLFVDMNLSPRWIERLARHRFDIVVPLRDK